jgi:hypothetical protein
MRVLLERWAGAKVSAVPTSSGGIRVLEKFTAVNVDSHEELMARKNRNFKTITSNENRMEY